MAMGTPVLAFRGCISRGGLDEDVVVNSLVVVNSASEEGYGII